MTVKYYKQLRNRYLPKKIKVIFILESPPKGGGYFYDPTGRPSELLFRSLMQGVLNKKFTTKEEGLQEFARAGYFLVDPIYTPVDKLPDREADQLILKNYTRFAADLKEIIKNQDVKLVLIKKNICQLLEPRLKQDGFKVLNKGATIPFPMHYHYPEFLLKIRELMN